MTSEGPLNPLPFEKLTDDADYRAPRQTGKNGNSKKTTTIGFIEKTDLASYPA